MTNDFMQPETYAGPYWEIDTSHGIMFLPWDVVGTPADWGMVSDPCGDGVREFAADGELTDAESDVRDCFTDYVDGEIYTITSHDDGELHRLSAPGYMDCTDWSTEPESDD